MSGNNTISVNLEGIVAETGRVPWTGADGIGVSAEGQYLVIAVHHAGATQYAWLGPDELDAFSEVLAGALRKAERTRKKLAAFAGGTLQ